MTADPFHTWNHFVPQFYLRAFASEPGLLRHYPILVSKKAKQPWNSLAISRAAAQEHFYTRIHEDAEFDDFERWLDREFESPAQEAIERAITGRQMQREHWKQIIRFWAAQDQRTLASYSSFISSQAPHFKATMDETFSSTTEQIRRLQDTDDPIEVRATSQNDQLFPMRVLVTPSENPGMMQVQADAVLGRKMWLWAVRQALRDGGPLDSLVERRWTILVAPEGGEWFTCDDPAIKGWPNRTVTRHVEGCWHLPGTILSMPLSPRHLLYTKVGYPVPTRGTVLSFAEAQAVRLAIAQYALRSIYSPKDHLDMLKLRPQVVDRDRFLEEERGRSSWHQTHTRAERFDKG